MIRNALKGRSKAVFLLFRERPAGGRMQAGPRRIHPGAVRLNETAVSGRADRPRPLPRLGIILII